MLIIPLVKRAVRSIPVVHRAVGRIRRYFDPLPEWADTIRNESVWWKSSRPDWRTILQKDHRAWKAARVQAENGPHILLATTAGGMPTISIVESMLAVALTLRGARVHILLCDKILPACLLTSRGFFPLAEEFVNRGPTESMCKVCFPFRT